MAKAKKDAVSTVKPKRKKKRQRSAHESRKALALAENKKTALYLRCQGHGYQTIADMMGHPKSTVFGWVNTALEEIPRENAIALRDMEMERLDRMMSKLMARFDEDEMGDPGLVGPILNIMDRRAKYIGLHKSEGSGDQLVDTMAQTLAQMMMADKPVLRPDGPVPANPVL